MQIPPIPALCCCLPCQQILVLDTTGLSRTWIYWVDAGPNTTGVQPDPPPDQTIASEIRFRDGSVPLIWDPIKLTWY